MVIINIFSGFVFLVITIRVFLLLKNKESGDEKFTKAVDLLIAMALVAISWGVIYAFFGYNTDADISKDSNVQENKTSPVFFVEDAKDYKKKNGK
jgi:hypothetical protein